MLIKIGSQIKTLVVIKFDQRLFIVTSLVKSQSIHL